MDRRLANNHKILNAELISAILFISFSIITSVIFYFYLTNFHSNSLKKYLVAISKTAALSIDGDKLASIQSPADMVKPEYQEIISYLQKVRANNTDIRFVYIMRKTDNPNVLSFVADADSLENQLELDENKNGIIEDSEKASLPGDIYDITNISEIKKAFIEPVADKNITIDQWGQLISGYAPIYNSQHEVVAILGVDLMAQDYYRLQNRTNTALFILISIFSLIIAVIFILVRQYMKEIKILQDVDRQKSDFISLASHQLRTPLSASKWGINMLQQGDFGSLGSEQKKAIADLCIVNEQMVALVNDLLKVSQTDSEGLKAKYSKVYIKKFCEEIIAGMHYLIVEKNIKFTFSCDDKINHLKTDPGLLKEILLNLLSNALKYTPVNGMVSFNVNLRFEEVIFEIKDSGYGIPDSEKKRIFTKFFRASNIMKKETSGTGLGLYFVKKVVELLDGRIDFTSKEGQGSIFYFYLPYKI